MIGFYISPIVTVTKPDGRVVQYAVPNEYIAPPAVGRCSVVTSIPVDPDTGLATANWCVCQVYGQDFTALDADNRVERLALLSQRNDPVDMTLPDRLTRFAVGDAFGTNAEMIERIVRRMNRRFQLQAGVE